MGQDVVEPAQGLVQAQDVLVQQNDVGEPQGGDQGLAPLGLVCPQLDADEVATRELEGHGDQVVAGRGTQL